MDIYQTLTRIVTRREQALEDSDTVLAVLLADCAVELIKAEKIIDAADFIIGHADAGNKWSGFLKQINEIDARVKLEDVYEYIHD